MAEILVEKLGVPAFFIANKSVMSLYGGGNMTGIAVDSGHDMTYIVPSYQVLPKTMPDIDRHLTIMHRATQWKMDPWCSN